MTIRLKILGVESLSNSERGEIIDVDLKPSNLINQSYFPLIVSVELDGPTEWKSEITGMEKGLGYVREYIGGYVTKTQFLTHRKMMLGPYLSTTETETATYTYISPRQPLFDVNEPEDIDNSRPPLQFKRNQINVRFHDRVTELEVPKTGAFHAGQGFDSIANDLTTRYATELITCRYSYTMVPPRFASRIEIVAQNEGFDYAIGIWALTDA